MSVYQAPLMALRKVRIIITAESQDGRTVTEDEGNGAISFFVPDRYIHADHEVTLDANPRKPLTKIVTVKGVFGEGLSIVEIFEKMLEGIDKER